MPHDLSLILTLTGGLSAALLFGYLTQRLRLSPIVGYLIAGVAVGPFTPGFVAHGHIAEQFAELGVILLMFGVGLQFHVKELFAVRNLAIPGAVLQIAVATALGMVAAHFLGWPLSSGAVFGLCISVASTVVLIRVLSDQGLLHTPAGHVAVGWLVVEDLFTVLALVLLPALVKGGQSVSSFGVVQEVLLALGKVILLLGFIWLAGRRLIPGLLSHVARTRSRELFTLTVLVLALGIAVGSAQWFGASMALGAFLAGIVVGQSDFSARAASEALPMRDAFAVLFFVSMGMLFDPSQLLSNAVLILCTLAIVLIGKPLAALFVVLVLKHPPRVAVIVAIALAQIGEFSFILAALGVHLQVLPQSASQALVVASIVSITVNPLLFRFVEPTVGWFKRRARPDKESAEPAPRDTLAPASHRNVIVGYGPIGKILVRLLRDNGVAPTVIDLNHETIRELRAQGVAAVYGDAASRLVLEQARVADAKSLIFTADNAVSTLALAEARELNPNIVVMARAKYLSETSRLEQAGATVVIAGEAEVAFAMVEQVLRGLGATEDQLDRERARVREEFSTKESAPPLAS